MSTWEAHEYCLSVVANELRLELGMQRPKPSCLFSEVQFGRNLRHFLVSPMYFGSFCSFFCQHLAIVRSVPMLRPVDTPPAMGNSAVAMPLIFFACFLRCKHSWLICFWNLETAPTKTSKHVRHDPACCFGATSSWNWPRLNYCHKISHKRLQ